MQEWMEYISGRSSYVYKLSTDFRSFYLTSIYDHSIFEVWKMIKYKGVNVYYYPSVFVYI